MKRKKVITKPVKVEFYSKDKKVSFNAKKTVLAPKTKKCLTCWTRIRQQEWKTQEERKWCTWCRFMIDGVQALTNLLQVGGLNRDFEIRWNWIKKK